VDPVRSTTLLAGVRPGVKASISITTSRFRMYRPRRFRVLGRSKSPESAFFFLCAISGEKHPLRSDTGQWIGATHNHKHFAEAPPLTALGPISGNTKSVPAYNSLASGKQSCAKWDPELHLPPGNPPPWGKPHANNYRDPTGPPLRRLINLTPPLGTTGPEVNQTNSTGLVAIPCYSGPP